jgi:hypothetical protein
VRDTTPHATFPPDVVVAMVLFILQETLSVGAIKRDRCAGEPAVAPGEFDVNL